MLNNHCLLIANFPDAFAYLQLVTDNDEKSLDYVFLDINMAFTKMIGLSRDFILNKKVTEVLPGVIDYDWINTCGKVIRKEETVCFEKYFETLNRWYEITAYRDKPEFIAVIFRNITDKKIGEKMLRESEEKFRSLFELSNDAHVLFDGVQYIDCNYACINMLGLSSREDLVSLHPKDISPHFQPDGRTSAEVAQEMIDLALSNGNHMFEWVCRRKDGTLLNLDVLLTRILLHGKPIIHGVWRDITERKRIEEALKESEARNQALLDAIPDLIFVYNREGEFIDYKANGDLLVSPEKFLNKKAGEVLPPDLALLITERLERVFNSGEMQLYEYQAVTDNVLKHFDARLVQCGENKALNIIRNVTPRKQAEEKLLEAHQRLLSVFDNIEAFIYVADMKTHEILFTNRYGEKLHGDIRGEKCWKIIQKDQTGPCDFCTNDKLLDASGKPTGLIQWELKSTRNGRWYSCRDTALHWIDGRMVRLEIATDITEYKQMQEVLQQEIIKKEHALSASEEQYRFIVKNMNEAIVIAQDGFHKFVNPMALKLFECTEEELTTIPIVEYIHPEDRDMILSVHRKRINGEDVVKRYPYRLKTKSDSIKWAEASAVAIDWEGRPATLVIITDISERRKMDEEMNKLDKLESIGILAGGIAHDFNNYLAALLGNTSLAKLYTDNPQKVLAKLENIEQATLRAKELSNKLFTFAKGSAPVKKTVILNQSIIDNINFTLSGSNVSSNYAIAENLHPVEIDEVQFNQVLNNIVLNAAQAMPEGGIIRVTADNFINEGGNGASYLPLPEGNYIKVTIQDKGIGISEKHLHKIFDPFFTTKQKGSGLGLATSYTIMHNHGGHIGVTSKPGEGTTFHLYLPASTKTVNSNPAADNIVSGSGRILVMDDQEDYIKVTGETLSTLGYEASHARDGREAITIYMDALKEDKPFDLVIMDLTIPGGMGGKETIKELIKKDPEVKAIVASGYSNDPVMANYHDYGFKGVLKKPFALAELSELVSQVIG